SPALMQADSASRMPVATTGDSYSNLDFLAKPAAVFLNLEPDKDGLIKIRRADLDAQAVIQVVAVDPQSTTVRSISLPEPAVKFLDLRLLSGLDPKGHFTQKKQINVLPAGKAFVIPDAVSSRFESYDSLAHVYGLYLTLSKDPKLAEFAFLLNW